MIWNMEKKLIQKTNTTALKKKIPRKYILKASDNIYILFFF